MAFQAISRRVDGRGVCALTLNRPDKRNALSEVMVGELMDALAAARDDPAVRVVVLTGAGKGFCAGGDLDWFLESVEDTLEGRVARSRVLGDLLQAVYELPKPVIGRINGPAFGAGVGLVAVCDVAVAGPGCRFAFSETRIGLVPATFAPYVVARIGAAGARRVMVSGAPFDSEDALRLGLVDEICEGAETLDRRVAEIAEEFIATAPGAVAMTKTMIPEIAVLDMAAARARVARIAGEAWETGEAFPRIAALLGKA